MRVLVTGVTGCVGSALIPILLERGHEVCALSRTREKLEQQLWFDRVHPVEANLRDVEALHEAVEGCDAVYYLVHSMIPGVEDFEAVDRRMADNVCSACEAHGVKRIFYMSGLGDTSEHLSSHLRSRHEVGVRLSQGATPVTIFRAAMIIGKGSDSFRMLRYLVERSPLFFTPSWVRTTTQPIAVDNVIRYFVEALEKEETVDRQFDIGGPDVLPYLELMQSYAKVAGLRARPVLHIPFFLPRLSVWWVALTTPIKRELALPLIQGLANNTICQENSIREIIPQRLLNVEEAISTALTD